MTSRPLTSLTALLPLAALTFAVEAQAVTHNALYTGTLETAQQVSSVRAQPRVSYGAPPAGKAAAWARFTRGAAPFAWQALWDRDTGAPVRIFGQGIAAPGAVGSPSVAEGHARAFFAAHTDLTGGSIADFDLVANDLDDGMRTVAFEQRALVEGVGRVPVIGGRMSVRYKNDRLIVIASEALPHSVFTAPSATPSSAVQSALGWVAPGHGTAAIMGQAELVALPLVGVRADVRLVWRVSIDATAPRARWDVYVDAHSGELIGREQTLRFAQATVSFDVPNRAPAFGRTTLVAPRLDVQVNGVAQTTDQSGGFSWGDPSVAANVSVGVKGTFVNVVTQSGTQATDLLMTNDGQPIVWSLANNEVGDAQLASYVFANVVKDHVRTFAPGLPFLDQKLTVKPNEQDQQGCNAFWDGVALNFLLANGPCHNTARIGDVVYHEFGHGFHQNVIIPGAGALDASLGEGVGDVMASSVSKSSHMAQGFFKNNNEPLRELDNNRHWPEDISSFDPHETGLIWAGAMWDLRVLLVQSLGEAQGHAIADKLFYQSVRRTSSIPAAYAEVLAADDDDGDLSNGTPNVCAINEAFIKHGIASVLDPSGLVLVHDPLTLVTPTNAPLPVSVSSKILFPQCGAGTSISQVSVRYRFGSGSQSSVTLMDDGNGSFVGQLPAAKDGAALRYQIKAAVGLVDATLPDNPADDEYRAYIGDVVPLYCNDFEAQIDGWTFGDTNGGKGTFQWGQPLGVGGDPEASFSGKKLIGTKLNGDGTYTANRTVFADSPVIDRKGEERVRLQLRRWLTVEDGVFDHARIYVNGKLLWENAGTNENDGSLTHRDHEWRFEDIDLTSALGDDQTIQVRFEIEADPGVELGGWNIDDLCVVAPPKPLSTEPGTIKVDTDPDDGVLPSAGCACKTSTSEGEGLGAFAALSLLGLVAARRRRR